MKTLVRSSLLALAFTTIALPAMHAQMSGMDAGQSKKPLASPAATTSVTLKAKTVTINYNSPQMRGRKIMGGLVPFGEVWRTGANAATTIITPVDLMIGKLMVPAGTYTLFTLPTAGEWQLIVSKKTGEWGIPYPEGSDLGRTTMMKKSLSAAQEGMTISFTPPVGNKTEMHIKWENIDVWVPVSTM